MCVLAGGAGLIARLGFGCFPWVPPIDVHPHITTRARRAAEPHLGPRCRMAVIEPGHIGEDAFAEEVSSIPAGPTQDRKALRAASCPAAHPARPRRASEKAGRHAARHFPLQSPPAPCRQASRHIRHVAFAKSVPPIGKQLRVEQGGEGYRRTVRRLWQNATAHSVRGLPLSLGKKSAGSRGTASRLSITLRVASSHEGVWRLSSTS